MSEFLPKVLGLFPNTRGFGYALMESPSDLIAAKSTSLKSPSLEDCIQRIEDLFALLKPDIVVLRDPKARSYTGSSRITRIINRIVQLTKNRNAKVYFYSREQVRLVFAHHNALNKHEIACTIAENFKDIQAKVPEKRKLWMPEGYHMSTFDAIALVITYFHMMD
ncbi:MAG: hypothetical protein AAF502_25490 [Bacteroidota bacterium]